MATLTTEETEPLAGLIEEYAQLTVEIKAGGHSTSLAADAAEINKKAELAKKLVTLKYTFKPNSKPPGKYIMEPLSCIPFNPASKFYQTRKITTESDQWWSRLSYEYSIDGVVTIGDVFPVFGCYLDLHPRDSVRLPTYGHDLINLYVPTGTVVEFAKQIQNITGHEISEGKEIIDDTQGLTSFLAATAGDTPGLTVSMYQKETDDDDNVTGFKVMKHDLNTLYKGAQTKPSARIIGGVAFVHVNANYSCVPNTYNTEEKIPPSVRVDMKFKLVGFHCLGISGDDIKQITYKKKQQFKY